MENVMTDKMVEISETEQAGLFYKMVNRRPLIDVVAEEGEDKVWETNFKNSNEITMYSWRNDWIANTKLNLGHFKYFNRENSVKVYANELIEKPVILLGAGPSLEKNIKYLHLAKEKGIAIMASHHTLMYLAEEKIKPDFVCCLDAGKTWTDYWATGKIDLSDVPLLTEQTCNHEQLKAYPGPVKFFRSGIPDKSVVGGFVKMELDRIINPLKCGSTIEVGGHVLGAMTSLARGVMNADILIYVGCDYCFDKEKFYPFDHKIDKEVPAEHFGGKEGDVLPAAPPVQGIIFDIFGNQVATNGAYLGFKNVMDQAIKINAVNALQTNNTLEIINATEGGALGSLIGGNSRWMKYLRLEDAIYYSVSKMDHLARIKAKKGG